MNIEDNDPDGVKFLPADEVQMIGEYIKYSKFVNELFIQELGDSNEGPPVLHWRGPFGHKRQYKVYALGCDLARVDSVNRQERIENLCRCFVQFIKATMKENNATLLIRRYPFNAEVVFDGIDKAICRARLCMVNENEPDAFDDNGEFKPEHK